MKRKKKGKEKNSPIFLLQFSRVDPSQTRFFLRLWIGRNYQFLQDDDRPKTVKYFQFVSSTVCGFEKCNL